MTKSSIQWFVAKVRTSKDSPQTSKTVQKLIQIRCTIEFVVQNDFSLGIILYKRKINNQKTRIREHLYTFITFDIFDILGIMKRKQKNVRISECFKYRLGSQLPQQHLGARVQLAVLLTRLSIDYHHAERRREYALLARYIEI